MIFFKLTGYWYLFLVTCLFLFACGHFLICEDSFHLKCRSSLSDLSLIIFLSSSFVC